MIEKLFAAILLIAITASGQTNELHLPLLVTAQRTFTNAIIIRHNPAYAVLEYDFGIVHVAVSNMPIELQKEFGYSPAAAAQFLMAEKEKLRNAHEKWAAQQAANATYLASLCGTNRPVQLLELIDDTTHGGILCETASGNILIRNVPAGVTDFLRRERRLKDAVANYQAETDDYQRRADAANNATPSAVSAVGNAAYVNAVMNDAAAQARRAANMAANAEFMQKSLEELQDELSKMESDARQKALVNAHPTGQFYGGNAIWIYE